MMDFVNHYGETTYETASFPILPIWQMGAERLNEDYWLYVAFNCAGTPELHTVRDPARLGWQPVVTVEHYQVGPNTIVNAGASEK